MSLTDTEVLDFIKQKLARKEGLEKDNQSTRSWWMCQLHKYRPDLSNKFDANNLELRAIDEFLRKVKVQP